METSMYSIYDIKAKTYDNPFSAVSDGVAERIFISVLSHPGRTENTFPQDFVLYRIGTYDNCNGRCVSLASPELLRTGSDVISRFRPAEQGGELKGGVSPLEVAERKFETSEE